MANVFVQASKLLKNTARIIFVAIVGGPILLLIVGVFGPPLFYVLLPGSLNEMCLPIQLRSRGRFIRSREIRNRIRDQGGTLIIESPAMGWNITRAWWTPDDVAGLSPFLEPMAEDYKRMTGDIHDQLHDWDRWCWEKYTSLDNGTAVLVRSWRAKILERKLARQFPQLKIVHTWTALFTFRPKAQPISNDNRGLKGYLILVGIVLVAAAHWLAVAFIVSWICAYWAR